MENQPTPSPDSFKEFSPAEACLSVLLTLVLLCCIEPVFAKMEKFTPAQNYRIPQNIRAGAQWNRDFDKSGKLVVDDYWVWQRWLRRQQEQPSISVLGDSFVWGEAVPQDETLSACLSQTFPDTEFANAGIDGLHPLAMQQLAAHYMPYGHGRKILVHCHTFWASSPEAEWKANKVAYQNPRLVPIFWPALPALNYTFDQRMDILRERMVPGSTVMTHLVTTAYDGTPLLPWIVEHPQENPLAQIEWEIPSAQEKKGAAHTSPYAKDAGFGVMPSEWTSPQKSWQFQAFLSAVRMLRRKGYDVFVLIGPSNIKVYDDISRATLRDQYARELATLEKKRKKLKPEDEEARTALDTEYLVLHKRFEKTLWKPTNPAVRRCHAFNNKAKVCIKEEGFAHALLEMPPELFADPFHPMAEGYRNIAGLLSQDDGFRAWVSAPSK